MFPAPDVGPSRPNDAAAAGARASADLPRASSWFTPPPAIRPEHYRIFALLGLGTLSAVGIHVVYASVFLAVGVYQMAAANLLSIPAYFVGYRATRRGHFETAVLIGLVELCYHQSLAVHYLGWGSGLQYFLLVIPSVAWSLPAGRNLRKLAMVAVAGATFLGLQQYARTHAPAHPLPEAMASAITSLSVVGIFGLLAFFAYNFAHAADVAEDALREQFDRAEGLLSNMLPASIAARLKRSHGVIADGVEGASVLFADIVGFTMLSSRLSPERVVELLNDLFSEFDGLVERHGLEKIKTIGDAYMVAAGVPARRADHAVALADFALDLAAVLRARGPVLGETLEMRVGLHSGPVVAGVIGRRRFIYDLWGDTVNVAARMESHGLAGQIQITRATRDLLGDAFVVERRGEISIKGKGEMEVFLLLGRCPPTR